MRIPTIWYKHSQEFKSDQFNYENGKWVLKKDVLQMYNFIGGSTLSEKDAKEDALKKRDIVKSKIDGNFNYKKNKDYEVDIREEIIATVNDENIITRNRYGALVLNSTSLVMVDVDDASFRWRYKWNLNVFQNFTNIFKRRSFREIIEEETAKFCDLYASKGAYVRLYRTPNGYRILLLFDQPPNPGSTLSKTIMSQFRSDYTYANMCIKQRCYRARLTPKPWRVKLKALKAIFPFRTVEEDIKHNEWVDKYHRISEKYAACRLMESFGNTKTDKALDYHDKFCKALSNLPLA